MLRLTAVLFFVPLLASAQEPAQPASAPATSAPATNSPAPNSSGAVTVSVAPPSIGEDEDAKLCLNKDSGVAGPLLLAACQRYLLKHPSGVTAEQVEARMGEIEGQAVQEAPTSQPVDDPYFFALFKHPRRKGDLSFAVVGGENTPNGLIGVQGGYYLASRLQAGLAVGAGQSGFRTGLFGRGYLSDHRISPMAALAVSASYGHTGFVGQHDDVNDKDVLIRVTMGPSALVHGSVGMSARFLNGISGSAEVGYAQPLFTQSIENALQPDELRDGGFFFALAVGGTFGKKPQQ